MPASSASAGMAFLTSAELATVTWRVSALMVTTPSLTSMPRRSPSFDRSMMSDGEARRCFIVGSSVMPPASNLPSACLPASVAASATVAGLW